ncbi:MAG: universal stress protein [Rhodospirillales bacterium]
MVNTILCPLSGAPENEEVLDKAYSVAKDLKSHLEVLHVEPEAKESIPLLGEGMSVAMVEDMIGMAEKEASERVARARKLFDEGVDRHNAKVADKPTGEKEMTVAWRHEHGREDEVVARLGRLNDMIVVARPGDSDDVLTPMTLNAAIFESGRPVLVVPPGSSGSVRKRIAISWNGSVQSARAVSAAVRMLEQAEAVMVLTADSFRTSGARGPELAQYLEWHGVVPDTKIFEAPAGSVGPKLLDECDKFGADLLVSGAYTHSRMRQLILGGVTKYVLGHAQIPMFMAH